MNLDKERLVLMGRFVAIALLAPLLAWMLSRAYQPGTLARQTLHAVAGFVAFGEGVALEMFPSLVLGLYFGLLTLFMLDSYKRYQGVLLLFGTALGLAVFASWGRLIANINIFDPFNWIAFVIGFVLALAIERAQFQAIFDEVGELKPEDLRFPRAVGTLFLILSAIVVLGFFQAIFAGNGVPIIDIPVTAAFVYLFFGFVQYDSKSDVAVIGPRESGKSLFLLSLYLVYRGREGAGGADGYMQELIMKANSMKPGDDFPVPNTRHLEKLSFHIVSGRVFPKRVEIGVTDHTGEYLNRLSENLEDPLSIREKLQLLKSRYKQRHPSGTLTSEEENFLFESEIRHADVLVLLLDISRIERGETDHIGKLQNIGKRASKNGAEVLVVATKCDLLIEEYYGFSRFVDNPLAEGFEDDFGQTIDQKLREEHILVDELIEEIDADRIYPVYYETEMENESRIPKLDENNNLNHHGTESIADRLENHL